MRRRSVSPDRFKIVSPCNQDWESMRGNDKVRFCSHCERDVQNLSAMTRQEIAALAMRSEGQLCVRYVRTPDGRIQTAPSPLRFVQLRRPSRIAAGLMTAALSLPATAVLAGAPSAEPVAVVEGASVGAQELSEGAVCQGGKSGTTVTHEHVVVAPGARLTLADRKTGATWTATADDVGRYAIPSLAPGSYLLSIQILEDRSGSCEVSITVDGSISSTSIMWQIRDIDTGGANPGGLRLAMQLAGIVDNDRSSNGRPVEIHAASNLPPLAEAVYNGSLKQARRLLRQGALPLPFGPARDTMLALATDDPRMTRLLLAWGADPTAANDRGVTPLMVASIRGDVKAIKLLIGAGANPNARDARGRTALMLAARHSRAAVVERLIAAGSSVNVRDVTNKTPLSYAIEGEDEETVALLRKAGAVE